jgi:hypothetical protein
LIYALDCGFEQIKFHDVSKGKPGDKATGSEVFTVNHAVDYTMCAQLTQKKSKIVADQRF